jgi:hypothetical protein
MVGRDFRHFSPFDSAPRVDALVCRVEEAHDTNIGSRPGIRSVNAARYVVCRYVEERPIQVSPRGHIGFIYVSPETDVVTSVSGETLSDDTQCSSLSKHPILMSR